MWKNVCGVCQDGGPALVGTKSGFLIKGTELASQQRAVTPRFTDTHFPIHSSHPSAGSTCVGYKIKYELQILSPKQTPLKKNSVQTWILIVEFFFTKLNSVLWFLKGNVNRVLGLRDEGVSILEVQGKPDMAWTKQFVYLAEMIGKLNELNLGDR